MKIKMHYQIIIAILVGIILGISFENYIYLINPIGETFIRLLKMIILPLIFSSVVTGIVNIGNISNLGKIGVKTSIYYMSTTFAAVFTGLILVNIIKPGQGVYIPVDTNMDELPSTDSFSFINIIKELVPENIIVAMVNNNLLGIIFFSILFGTALLIIGKKNQAVVSVVESLNHAMLKITDWIMILAPYGVCALMASLVSTYGIETFRTLFMYMLTVIVGLSFHCFVTLFIAITVVGRYSPIHFYKEMFPALATAFSTDSSLATLPVTIDCLEKVGVSNRITSFVAPLGATINMDGTALYEAIAAIFIAQVFGIELTLLQQLIIFFTAALASIGAAGIPSAGLVTMIIVLKSVNLPIEGIGLILAVDRILDMFRTTVNVFGDATGSLIIAKLEGEKF